MTAVDVVMIVADVGLAETLASTIRADARAAALVLIVGDGGDETLDLAIARQPSVVVVAEHLEAGDGWAFVSALREQAQDAGAVAPWVTLVADHAGGGVAQREAVVPGARPDRVVARADVRATLVDAVLAGLAGHEAERFPSEVIELPRDTLPMRAVAAPNDDADADADGGEPRDLTVVLPHEEPDPEMGFDLGAATPVPALFGGAPSAGDGDGAGTGDLARNLRQKMSAMAQRLFRGGDTPGPEHAPAVGGAELPAEPPSEFDLAAFGDDRRAHTELDDLVNEPIAPPVGTTAARLSREADVPGGVDGEPQQIVLGERDAATLTARAIATSLTGVLELTSGTAMRRAVFEQGRLVYASSSVVADRLGQLLVREGKITTAQLRQALDVVAESGRRTGEVLVDLGFLKRREHAPAVRRHLEEIVYGMFGMTQGAFRWQGGTPASGERIRLARAPAAIVVEGVRRKFATADLARLVGGPTVVLLGDRERLTAIASSADLSLGERALVGSLDGNRTLADAADEAGLELEVGLPIVWAAEVLGAVSRRGAEARASGDDGASDLIVAETDLAIDRERVRARYALVERADYFTLLGVRADASPFELRRAYETARRDFAPETFAPEIRREYSVELDEIARVLDEAFAVLRHEPMRSRYAAHLERP